MTKYTAVFVCCYIIYLYQLLCDFVCYFTFICRRWTDFGEKGVLFAWGYDGQDYHSSFFGLDDAVTLADFAYLDHCLVLIRLDFCSYFFITNLDYLWLCSSLSLFMKSVNSRIKPIFLSAVPLFKFIHFFVHSCTPQKSFTISFRSLSVPFSGFALWCKCTTLRLFTC